MDETCLLETNVSQFRTCAKAYFHTFGVTLFFFWIRKWISNITEGKLVCGADLHVISRYFMFVVMLFFNVQQPISNMSRQPVQMLRGAARASAEDDSTHQTFKSQRSQGKPPTLTKFTSGTEWDEHRQWCFPLFSVCAFVYVCQHETVRESASMCCSSSVMLRKSSIFNVV